MLTLLAAAPPDGLAIFIQQFLNGLTTGTLFALIAIGYTMVYGIIELINFAHGDLFMLGSFLALTLVGWLGLAAVSTFGIGAGLILVLLLTMTFCAALNVTVWSYVDQFNLCILADRDVLPDTWQLMEHFEASLAELEAVAVTGSQARAAAVPTP